MFILPTEIRKRIQDYKSAAAEFVNGKMNPARFSGIRVPWGIYSHRDKKVFMVRVRIPAGLVTAPQLKALAHVAQAYGNGNVHCTTRQDIQIHAVKIEDTPAALEYLQEYDLSPRGGGGNTLRNVTACAFAGVCRDEAFDVREYAVGLTECLMRYDTSYNLPRKFKIVFSGCDKDCAGVLANDLGFAAAERDGEKGFAVFAGGGMGTQSRLGRLLEEFLPAADVPYCAQAVKNVFYANGDRKNKHHNRLRFLIEDRGFEAFARLYGEEFRRLKENEYLVLRKVDVPRNSGGTPSARPAAAAGEYGDFLAYNVTPQKQPGFSIVQLRIPRGDLSHEKLRALSALENRFEGIEFRVTQNQNIALCGVRDAELPALFAELKRFLSGFLYPATLLDTTVCKGALTCNLGLCNSPGLSEAIEAVIEKEFVGTRVFRHLDIKLNGCPNACGQHPLGKIAFHGLVKRVGTRPVPFYKLLLGGRKEREATRLAVEAGILPARNVPAFLRRFLRELEGKLDGRSDVHALLAGEAAAVAKKLLNDYAYVPSFDENREFYVDWGKTEEFSLAGIGPGECGAGIIDMIESDLADARRALAAPGPGAPAAGIKKALFFAARALLIVKGCEPGSEEGAVADFKRIFVDGNIADARYGDITDVYAGIGENPGDGEREHRYAQEFLAHIDELYGSMDAAFNFPRTEPSPPREQASAPRVLDLKGVACPLNYAKTKMALEPLRKGDLLEVVLDEGEPIENVPRSLRSDGHEIIKIEQRGRVFGVLIRKGEE